MTNAAWVVGLMVVLAAGACGKKSRPPEPPAAPATPPPAPAAEAPEPAPAPDEYERLRSMSPDEIDRMNLLEAIHFDFDRFDIREDARATLARNAEVLRRFDFVEITIEGHCDERGTIEYNLGLGDRRAQAARDYLASLGVDVSRMHTASFGKEAPLCSESTEDCWARNRRAHFKVTGKAPR